MATTTTDNLELLIQRMKKTKGRRDTEFAEDELVELLLRTRELFMMESAFMEIDAPITVVGDIHGQFYDLLRLFDKTGYPSATHRFLFLGDYVDRGSRSIECVALLFAYKLLYPSSVIMLRGNHETVVINKIYGFMDECRIRFSESLFYQFQDVFNAMPLSALISKRILCMHGGLSESLRSFNQLRGIRKPCTVPNSGIICDLLWADPTSDNRNGWQPSDRGCSQTFGAREVIQFCDTLGIDLVVRGHQVAQDGYAFFADRHLVTLFSAPNYCGEFENNAAAMHVDQDLACSFIVITYDKKDRSTRMKRDKQY